MAKRMLTNEGQFVPFVEDVEESERIFKMQGTTREEVEANRRRKQQAGKKIKELASKELLISTMSNEELEAELKKREVLESEVKPIIPKPAVVEEVVEEEEVAEGYEELTVAELKALVIEKELEVPKKATKKQLIALLEEEVEL